MKIPIGAIPVHDRIYLTLGGLLLVAGVLFAVQPAAWWIESLPSRAVLLVSVAILFLVALVLAVLLWPFNLDDKWVYYRISRIIFSDGVPNYNAGEWFNVNTSFYILISHCQGPFLGDFRPWEAWTKFLGLCFHLGTAFLVLAMLGIRPICVITATACALYVPALLWSLGGLETPMVMFAVVFASFLVAMIVFVGFWQPIHSARITSKIKRPLGTEYPRHFSDAQLI